MRIMKLDLSAAVNLCLIGEPRESWDIDITGDPDYWRLFGPSLVKVEDFFSGDTKKLFVFFTVVDVMIFAKDGFLMC